MLDEADEAPDEVTLYFPAGQEVQAVALAPAIDPAAQNEQVPPPLGFKPSIE